MVVNLDTQYLYIKLRENTTWNGSLKEKGEQELRQANTQAKLCPHFPSPLSHVYLNACFMFCSSRFRRFHDKSFPKHHNESLSVDRPQSNTTALQFNSAHLWSLVGSILSITGKISNNWGCHFYHSVSPRYHSKCSLLTGIYYRVWRRQMEERKRTSLTQTHNHWNCPETSGLDESILIQKRDHAQNMASSHGLTSALPTCEMNNHQRPGSLRSILWKAVLGFTSCDMILLRYASKEAKSRQINNEKWKENLWRIWENYWVMGKHDQVDEKDSRIVAEFSDVALF